MIQQIEIDIQNLLREKKDLKTINNLLWKKWKHSSFDSFSIHSYSSFLFESQEWDKLIYLSLMQIKHRAPVAWDYLAECLDKVTDQKLRVQTLKACLKLFQSPDYEIPYLKTLVFDSIESAAQDWRTYHWKQIKKQQEQVKTTLIDQLRMFKHSANFSDYEKRALIKIEKMYPNDAEVKAVTEVAKIKEYKDILQKYGKNYLSQNEITPDDKKVTLRLKKVLINDCNNWIKNPNCNPFDFVYLFVFIEAYTEAIALLENLTASPNKDWLMLDLLMLDRRYSQALAWTDYLEDSSQHNYQTDKLSHIYYHRARCLWELGQKQIAISVIEQLLQFNPEYRIANHLLYEWRSAV